MRVKVFAALAVAAGIAAALVAGVILAGGGTGTPSSPQGTTEPATPAVSGPRVPVLAGADPVTGKRVSLRQFDGEPLIVNVWASWCEPCNDEAPLFTAFLEQNPDAVL